MSRDAGISLKWADGEYAFRLPIGRLIELQEKCDAGPAFIMTRLQQGVWRVEDVRETIRLGLIGGGTKPTDALKLVERYVDERPMFESVVTAEAIISAALVGAPDEQHPKLQADQTETSPLSGQKSDGPPSSVQG